MRAGTPTILRSTLPRALPRSGRAAVMHRQLPVQLHEIVQQTARAFDGDAFVPRDRMPAHFPRAARREAHRERSVAVFLDGPLRVEQKRARIAAAASASKRNTTLKGSLP